MPIIKCKMCGGDIELSADKTFGTCEYCGSVMTLPKIEDDQRAAAFNRGNHFRRVGEFEKALAVYERIVAEDNTDAEAHWCCALCRFGIEYVEDPTTYEWLPTCHRASFDSILEDVDYLAALEYSEGITRRQYQKDGAKIAEVQRAVLATSQKEEPFDVFICYKESDEDGNRTVDSTLAQDIYYQLTDKGYRVFFSRITLEDKVGAEYEPYIFAALNSAKVMIVVGTKPEHISAVWVKNEWSRFLALMRKDRSKLLLPCYRDMDPYDLPEQLSVLQSYDMSKIGFIQDLIRGVSKVLDAEKEVPVAKETVIVQSEGGSNVEALLMRGQIALEDKDWSRADNFYEQVLNQDAKCAEAYLGKLLVSEECTSADAFVIKQSQRPMTSKETKTACEEDRKRIVDSVNKYIVPGFFGANSIKKLYQFDRTYQSEVSSLQEAVEHKKRYFREDRLFGRIVRFSKDNDKLRINMVQESILEALKEYVLQAEAEDKENKERIIKAYELHLEKAEVQAIQMHDKAVNDREEFYVKVCKRQEALSDEKDAEQTAALFSSERLHDYKDSEERANECLKLSKQIIQQKVTKLRDQEKKRKIRYIIEIAALVVLFVGYPLGTKVIIPEIKYHNAERLLQSGQYEDAMKAFSELGEYKNSTDMITEAKYLDAEMRLESGDYNGAIEAFGAIGYYMDSAEKMTEAKYKRAEMNLESGNFSQAIEEFTALSGYNDSAEQLEEAKYKKAKTDLKMESLLDPIEYQTDISYLKEDATHEKADKLLEKAYEKYIKALLASKQIHTASIADIPDSFWKRHQKLCYKVAVGLEENGLVAGSIRYFEKYEDFKNGK